MTHRRGTGHRPARRTPALALVACLALGAAGCGGSSSSSRPAADPASPPTTPSPAKPAVEPASGRKVDSEAFTARLAQGYGYGYDNSLAEEIVFASSRDYRQRVQYSDVTIYPGTSNAFAARLAVRTSTAWHPQPRLAAPVTIAGARFYHLVDPVAQGRHLDEFGSVEDARLVKVSFELHGPPARRRKLIDSVLATVHLK